jgi:hypothetical protein
MTIVTLELHCAILPHGDLVHVRSTLDAETMPASIF